MTDSVPDIDRDVRAAWNESAPHEQWLVEVNSTDGYVIATSEKDRSFLRIPVLVGDSVEFGRPVTVVPGYVDAPIAASRVVFASRVESRPEVAATQATILDTPPDPRPPAEPAQPSGPPPEPEPTEEPSTPPQPGGVPVSGDSPGPDSGAEPVTNELEGDRPVSTLSADVRSRLGLTDDADDAAVVAALDALKTKADTPTEPNPEQVAASAATAKENDDLRAKVTEQEKEVTVLASQMKTVTAELAATKAKEAATVKASVLDDAFRQGKFFPTDRAQWEADYDEAPAAVTRILASIAPGTAVPVAAAGYTGTGDESEGLDLEVGGKHYNRLFGETEKTGA